MPSSPPKTYNQWIAYTNHRYDKTVKLDPTIVFDPNKLKSWVQILSKRIQNLEIWKIFPKNFRVCRKKKNSFFSHKKK